MRKDSYVIGSTIYQLEDPGQWQSYDLSRSPGGHTDGVEAHTSKGKGTQASLTVFLHLYRHGARRADCLHPDTDVARWSARGGPRVVVRATATVMPNRLFSLTPPHTHAHTNIFSTPGAQETAARCDQP